MVREKEIRGMPGWLMVFLLSAAVIGSIAMLVRSVADENALGIIGWLVLLIVVSGCYVGLTVVNPNLAKVVLVFGDYKGTIKKDGFWWVNPFSTRRRISLRVRNFESGKLKVNDQDGNPIEIAAVVVWKVVDTAEALFQVDDFEHFVHVQSEAALRVLATSYPYDSHGDSEMSLRMSVADIAHRLRDEIQERLAKAGVEVIEARISHLAYAAEIASAMLRRQQASAIIAARQKIVEGAVGMVEMALDLLSKRDVVTLDNDRKAAMVSNLLVVLCGDRNTQPVVNTGTIYQ